MQRVLEERDAGPVLDRVGAPRRFDGLARRGSRRRRVLDPRGRRRRGAARGRFSGAQSRSLSARSTASATRLPSGAPPPARPSVPP